MWWVTNWKIWQTSVMILWTRPEPTCLVTAYVLSELLTWLRHKGNFSNTVIIWPQNICWQWHLNRTQSKLTLTFQINFLPSSTLIFRSIHVLSSSRLLCVHCLCSQSVNKSNMNVMSEWKHWWVSVPQWEHLQCTHIQQIFLDWQNLWIYVTSGTQLWMSLYSSMA
jgi:hypothetical protein